MHMNSTIKDKSAYYRQKIVNTEMMFTNTKMSICIAFIPPFFSGVPFLGIILIIINVMARIIFPFPYYHFSILQIFHMGHFLNSCWSVLCINYISILTSPPMTYTKSGESIKGVHSRLIP